jgi:lipopolysaccharide transport protein LptA
MMRIILTALFCGALALNGCSKRERSRSDDAEWADIQPLEQLRGTHAEVDPSETNAAPLLDNAKLQSGEQENYAPLIERLAEMQQMDRGAGQAMITGESLTFNYERRFVRMDQDVLVVDDRGELRTEILMGRFSEDNQVEIIEASKGVEIVDQERKAVAEGASYVLSTGAIELHGAAQLTEGVNRLSGERIRFWMNGNRRMICEPRARLEVSSMASLEEGEVPEKTEITADRLVYDEEQALAEFEGNVYVREARAIMNADKVLLYLKEKNEIDWLEARSEVIIQTEDRKALADKASYYVAENKFVLEGDPKIKQGLNIMTGDQITYWHETGRAVCEPNARILFHPDAEMRAKFMKDLK